MNYIEVDFYIKLQDSAEIPKEMVRDILIAELDILFYESFVNTDDGLKAYIKETDFNISCINRLYIMNHIDFEISMKSKIISKENWNKKWEESFESINVNGQCVIRAPFHKYIEVDYDIVIEPKMSFGTGHHETTYQMIVHMLDLNILGKRVLDMGCGTGILSILSSKMGAKSVTAIDIDFWAIKNTIENIRINKCSKIIVKQGDASILTSSKSYDIILANINRNILIQDMEIYAKSMSTGAIIVFSGFYKSDIKIIQAKCRVFDFQLLKHTEKNLWSSLVYQKN